MKYNKIVVQVVLIILLVIVFYFMDLHKMFVITATCLIIFLLAFIKHQKYKFVEKILSFFTREGDAVNENHNKNEKTMKKINNNEKKYWLLAILISILTVVLFIGGFIVVEKCFEIGVTPNTTLLTFVGILATFVVVSNYAQVAEIKRDFLEKTKEIAGKLNSITQISANINDTMIINIAQIENDYLEKRDISILDKLNVYSELDSSTIYLRIQDLLFTVWEREGVRFGNYNLVDKLTDLSSTFCHSNSDVEISKKSKELADNIIYDYLDTNYLYPMQPAFMLLKHLIKRKLYRYDEIINKIEDILKGKSTNNTPIKEEYIKNMKDYLHIDNPMTNFCYSDKVKEVIDREKQSI